MAIDTPDWVRDAVFYQVFPDRFARSGRVPKPGPLEPWDSPPTTHGFKGGDLLRGRGAARRADGPRGHAIYLNPVFASASNHRYHTYDYYTVDPLLGGDAALRELLDAAHARGIRVILDGVFNHASRGFWPFNHILESGAASPYVDWFHIDREALASGRPCAPTRRSDGADDRAGADQSPRASATRPGGTCPRCPSSTPTNPQVARVPAAASPSTGSGSASTAGASTCPPRSTTTTSGASSGGAAGPSNPEAYIVAEIWHEAPAGSPATSSTPHELPARPRRSSSFAAAGHLDERRSLAAAIRVRACGRRWTGTASLELERLMRVVRPGDHGGPAQPARQPRHARGS